MNKTYPEPYRIQKRFWLDITRPLENELVHYIDDLKKKRSFTSTIRDALRLIKDLRQGSIRVLLLLFPWVWDQIEAEVRAEIVDPRPLEIHPALEAHMERLEKLLTERSFSPFPVDAPPPKALPRTLHPAPDASESLEIKAAAGDGKRATQNFMRSLMAIQTSYKKDDLTARKIDNTLPEQADTMPTTRNENTRSEPARTSAAPGKNPKKIEVPDLKIPNFDDDLYDLDTLMTVNTT